MCLALLIFMLYLCLISYSEQQLKFPAPVCLLIILLTVVYPFVFLLQVEEHLLAFLVMQVL